MEFERTPITLSDAADVTDFHLERNTDAMYNFIILIKSYFYSFIRCTAAIRTKLIHTQMQACITLKITVRNDTQISR